MIISKIEVEQFRMLQNQSFELGENITAIVGQNGTMKSTLLGMIGEPFRFREKSISSNDYPKTIDGKPFEIKFSDAFKFSDGPNGYEKAGDHKWTAHINASVYPEKEYKAITIPRTSIEQNDIRTWQGEGKGKGQKHVQFPTLYLSLKRLVPIGEERKVEHSPIELTVKERDWFEKYHKQILLLQQDMERAEFIKSSNKSSLGFATENYDSLTNSAGQDNIGKILMSILSFTRLKEELATDYQGGLLLIDEIDATLYPAAQKKLLEALMKYSHELSLQIIFTTHSIDAIDVLCDPKYSTQCKILYLETKDNKTTIFENLPKENIKAHLRAESVQEHARKIKVFSEDSSTRLFAKKLLPVSLRSKLDFINISLGEGELNNLRKVGLSDFVNGLIIFDGDIDVESAKYKSKNSVALPGGMPPEKVFYKFLKDLPAGDQFWSDEPGGYSKQTCFSGYESNPGDDIGQVKTWFTNQKGNFGGGCSKLVTRWKLDYPNETKKFQDDILEAYNAVGGKV